MAFTSVLFHSKTIPFCNGAQTNTHKYSLKHFNKLLQCHLIENNLSRRQISNPFVTSLSFSFVSYTKSCSSRKTRTHLYPSPECAFSDTFSSESQNPLLKPFKNLLFDSVKATVFSQLTPIVIIKWSAVLSTIAAIKWIVDLVYNPFFWMYFSWSWLFWPSFVAISLAFYGLCCFRKHSLGEANIFEQLAIVTSVFTWLTLVPPAYFNGFLEGWPYVFCFVYHYFFFFNVSVRKRLYGDYYARPHDPKWDVNPPNWHRLLFFLGIMVGHWLAAFEGPELHKIPGGFNNVGILVLIVVTLLMQYSATLYLAKYSEKVVVPTDIVQFGPYRWVRHPIYSSTMLLFATYCVALRSPLSLLFLVAVCLVYYEQKAKLEEALMVETFGERYVEYANEVRYKFIPFVY